MKKIKEFLNYLKNSSAFKGGKTLAYIFIAASITAGALAYLWNKYAMHMDISIF